jgi:adenylosuccinate lyase
MTLDYETYLSPYTWRYGSTRMRLLWSEAEKRRAWRRLWVALAEVQAEFGLITGEQVTDLQKYVNNIDVPRALQIEAEVQHDLMAELKTFAGQARLGGGILHLGATSMDIEDNADVLRMRAALDMTLEGVQTLLLGFAEKITAYAHLPLIALTHLQPAEPSTLGYRLAIYAQDLLNDWRLLRQVRASLRGKGFKGAVGTGASYAELIGVENLADFEQRLSQKLDLPFYPVAAQVYPRKQDYQVLSALAGLGGSLYKFAFDLRILQFPPLGELSEPFGKNQVGSSAMPFKRNPISAEKIDSLARLLAQMPRVAWDNAAHSLLERTLDDSANRRSLLPEAFLITDELLRVTQRLLSGLQVNEQAISRNLAIYGPFAAIERVLMALAKEGADRQEMHERLRQHAMQAWSAMQAGQANPLGELILADAQLQRYLPEGRLRALMEGNTHLGDAPARALNLAGEIHQALAG